MYSTNWKQKLAILGLLTGLVVPAIGQAGDAVRAEPRKKATPVREVAPSREAAPAQEVTPTKKQRVQPGSVRQQRSNDQPGGDTSPGGAQPGFPQIEQATKWELTALCSMGFAKELKPDHAVPFYECRLPASPPCQAGWGHEAVFDKTKPHQFKYACVAPNPGTTGAGTMNCPQGWTHSSPQVWKYYCTSNIFMCGPDYQLDGIHREGQPPIFKYRCNPK
ncbi:MAG: hypothetical protein GY723_20535 [bacterium]|nr:hypothetical protein [bacterium]